MPLINQLLTSTELTSPLSPVQAESFAADLGRAADLVVYPRSMVARGE